MAKVNLGDAELIDTIQDTDNVLVETGGSVRRVSLSTLLESESGKTVADDLAVALADLIPQSGLGNLYVRLVNSDEGDSVVSINGVATTIPAGETFEGFIDSLGSFTFPHYFKSIVTVGDWTGRIGAPYYSSSFKNNTTLESVRLYYSTAGNYCCSNTAWFYYMDAVTELVIRGKVKSGSSCQSWFHPIGVKEIDGLTNIDFSETTVFEQMFYDCASMERIDMSHCHTAKVENMSSMFRNCSSLTTILLGDDWDMGAVTSTNNMFPNCSSLTTVTGTILNLKISLDVSASPLTRESALVFINGLSDEPSEDSPTLSLSSTTKALLTDDDIAIATNKGWTIA